MAGSTLFKWLFEESESISWRMKEDFYKNAGSVFLAFLRSDIRFDPNFYSPIAGCPSPRSNSAILASVVPQTDRIRSCDLFHYCCSVFSRVHNNAAGSFPRSAYLSLYAEAQPTTRISPRKEEEKKITNERKETQATVLHTNIIKIIMCTEKLLFFSNSISFDFLFFLRWLWIDVS